MNDRPHSLGDVAFRLIAEAESEYAIYLLDHDGRIATWNRTAERIKGFTAEDVLGEPFATMFLEEERRAGRPERLLSQVRAEGRVELEERRGRKDGSRFWALVTISALEQDGHLVGYSVVLRDVTQRRRQATLLRLRNAELAEAERTAAEHAARLRTLLDHTPAGIAFVDRNARYLEVNETLAKKHARRASDFVGRTMAEMVPQFWPQIGPILEQVLGGETVSDVPISGTTDGHPNEIRHWRASFHPVHDDGGTVMGAALFIVDETERRLAEEALRRSEDALRQAQKLEAIGQLAGGVAHDFNNLLTVISVYSDQLLSRFGPDDRNHEAAAAIREAGERAAALTGQLLAFSRKAIVEPRIVQMNDAVARAARMLRRLIGEDIDIAANLAEDLVSIRIDPTQAEQVLLNLAVNARDAMPQGGRLTITTRNVDVDPGDSSVPPGRYAELAVEDTGVGMSDEVRARIFEPFFTTKELGKGTGLGLATVYGIVKQAGGHIEVSSRPGAGSTFRVLLPASGEQVSSHSAVPPRPESGCETVLLVEDEEMVRRVARRTLEESGYRVLEAASGDAALEVAVTHPGDIHLLLTDVVMPGMNGRRLADALRGRRPSLKVLFMSGHTDDAKVQQRVDSTDAFLGKPFTPRILTRKVRAVLDGE